MTVTHRFGETTIPAAPQRIVALGQTDCDPLIALGITPIAIGSFVDKWYDPVHPWNEEGFAGEQPEELNFLEVEFEKVAALQPDLITMVSGGISKKDYETLSKIAPVVGTPVGFTDSAVPYGPHTVLIGQCVGREDEAKQIVADVDAAYAAVRDAHPEWGSLNAIHAESYTGSFQVLGKNAPRTTFLTSVGFTLSDELDEITGNDYATEISAEQLDLVGGLDLVVWCTDEGAIPDVQKDPVVQRLASTKSGRSIWMTYAKTDQFMWAMDWNTVPQRTLRARARRAARRGRTRRAEPPVRRSLSQAMTQTATRPAGPAPEQVEPARRRASSHGRAGAVGRWRCWSSWS